MQKLQKAPKILCAKRSGVCVCVCVVFFFIWVIELELQTVVNYHVDTGNLNLGLLEKHSVLLTTDKFLQSRAGRHFKHYLQLCT